jgi:hypothetical protein
MPKKVCGNIVKRGLLPADPPALFPSREKTVKTITIYSLFLRVLRV